ncbi:hypothetical protein [Streptomyces sp. NPDC002403]
MSRRLRTTLACLALAAGIASSTATPAAAADGWQPATDVMDSSYNNGYSKECTYSGADFFETGEGCFQPYGEWVWIRDLDANNFPVGVSWSWTGGSTSRSGVIYFTGGKAAGWANVNKSFAEGGTFTWNVCEVNTAKRTIYYNTCGPSQSTTT